MATKEAQRRWRAKRELLQFAGEQGWTFVGEALVFEKDGEATVILKDGDVLVHGVPVSEYDHAR